MERIFRALVLLAALATPCLGFSFLLRTMRCVGGPAEWCRDLETAKACRAEQYCQNKVWNNEAQAAHNRRKNDAGEVVFSSFKARPFKTMEKIMDMQMKEMEGLMNSFMGGGDDIFGGFFGDKGERKENDESPFKQFFQTSNDDDEEFPISPFKQIFQIHNLIFNSVDGQNEEANDKTDDRADDKNDDKNDDDDVCGVCINITTTIRDELLSEKTEDEVLSSLEGLCAKLGPAEAICSQAVKTYIPAYFEMARNFLNNPKMLCEIAGLCKVSVKAQNIDIGLSEFPSFEKAPTSYKVFSKGCSLCSNVAHGLKVLLKVPGFAENFPSTVCDLFPESDQDCLELMEGFVAVFHEQLDPAVVCSSSFCPNSGVDEILEAAEDDVFEAADNEFLDNRIEEDETTTVPPTTVPPKTTTPPPKPLPRVCKKCIRHTRISIRFMERKLWHDRRRWLWGCKYALNKTKCVEAVNHFVKKAEEGLKKMCPHKICSKMGFCPPVNCSSSDFPHDHFPSDSSSSSDTILSVPMMSLQPSAKNAPMHDKCADCEEAVKYIKIILGNKESVEEIKQVFVGLCSQAGPMKDACIQVVNQKLDGFVEKWAHADTKYACIALHLCDGSSSADSFLSSFSSSSVCTTCKSFMKSTILSRLSSVGSERDLAIGLCHAVGRDDLLCHKHVANFLTIAKSTVDAFGSSGLQENVCKPLCQTGLPSIWEGCASFKGMGITTESLTTTEPVTTTGAPTTEPPTTTKAPTTEPPTTTAPPPPQPPVCERCIAVIGMIKGKLSLRLSCLETRLSQSCRLFPPLKAECEAAVNAFFAPLKEKIAAVVPKDVCIMAGVCNPGAGPAGADIEMKEVIMSAKKIMPAMSLLPSRHLVYKGGRAKQLADLFGGVGPVVPAQDVFPDLSFLDKQDSESTAKTDDGNIRVSAKKAADISIPSLKRISQAEVLTMDASQKVSTDAACTVCSYLVDDLKVHWSVEGQEELKALMMAGCTKLPVKQRNECMEFMAPKVKDMVEFVENIPTKEICQIVKACPSPSTFALSTKLPSDSMQCYACKFAGEELKEVWSNPNVPSTINNTLHSICLKLPADYQPQCHQAIDQTFPVLSGMIKDMDPKAACSSVGICEASARHLLGSDDCTWHLSPQILCADWKRAKKCGKVDLCRAQVWGEN